MAPTLFDSLLHLLSLCKLERSFTLASYDPQTEVFNELLSWALRVLPDLPLSALVPSLVTLLGHIHCIRDEVIMARLLAHTIALIVAKGLSYEEYIARMPSPLVASLLEHAWLGNALADAAAPTPRRTTGISSKASPTRKTPTMDLGVQTVPESGSNKGRAETLFPSLFVGTLARVLLHVLPIAVARLAHSCEAILCYHSK